MFFVCFYFSSSASLYFVLKFSRFGILYVNSFGVECSSAVLTFGARCRGCRVSLAARGTDPFNVLFVLASVYHYSSPFLRKQPGGLPKLAYSYFPRTAIYTITLNQKRRGGIEDLTCALSVEHQTLQCKAFTISLVSLMYSLPV